MATNFGWKALVGIIISNGVYFFIFRREFRGLQEKFAIKILKDEIQQKYLRSREFDAEFDKIEAAADKELGFAEAIDQRLKEMIEKIKSRLADRLRERHLSSIISDGTDQSLLREAFEQRFEEIRLREMRRSLPGLLPDNERPLYLDPQWDNRDDLVPGWVTLVHVFFMIWTIANAPNPAGQSILKKYFENGVSPAGLFKAAIVPTLIVWRCYLILLFGGLTC